MSTRPILVSALAALCLVAPPLAQASERTFAPVPSAGQVISYDNGETVISARNQAAALAIVFVPQDKKSALVKVWAENLGEQPFNFGDTSVTAASGGTALTVLTYADRLKTEKRREMWSKVAVALAAGANSMAASNAGYSTQYGSYRSTTHASAYGSGGSAYGSASTYGSYSGTTYNSAVAQQAQAAANSQNQLMVDRNRANAEFERQDLDAKALRMTTLMPQKSVIGDVQLALPKKSGAQPAEFVLTVDLAGEPVSILYREVN
jgi:hypothetical protein